MKTFDLFEDYLRDDSFRRWATDQGTYEDIRFWEAYVAEHPAGEWQKAREILLTLEAQTLSPTDQEVDQGVSRILEDTRPALRKWYRRPAGIAAAVAVMLLGAFWFFRTETAVPALTTVAPTDIVVRAGSTRQLVLLPDGSSVDLQPQSSLTYAATFSTDSLRKVSLTGEAFFEVAKNPQKPFFVYTASLVTKVVGTSFTVRSRQGDARVMVKTGKVSVFRPREASAQEKNTQLTGLVLLPDQQVILRNNELTRSLSVPVSLKNPVHQQHFEFSSAPVSDVFATLEKAYGVKIQYDPVRMKNCYLTASLDDEPLTEKLNLICQTLDASFVQQTTTRIAVDSKGCD